MANSKVKKRRPIVHGFTLREILSPEQNAMLEALK